MKKLMTAAVAGALALSLCCTAWASGSGAYCQTCGAYNCQTHAVSYSYGHGGHHHGHHGGHC